MVSAVIYSIFNDRDLNIKAGEIQEVIYSSEYRQSVRQVLSQADEKNEIAEAVAGWVIIFSGLFFLFAIYRFGRFAFQFDSISLLWTGLVLLPLLLIFGIIGIISANDYRLYAKILPLISRLRDAGVSGQDAVELSSEERSLLEQVETLQLDRHIKNAAGELPSALIEAYSISYSQQASKQIESLSATDEEAHFELRKAIDSLQSNPRPDGSQAVTDNLDLFQFNVRDLICEYSVDDKQKKVEILKIGSASGGGASNG